MNKCYKHSNKDAIRKCTSCGVDLCELCIEIKDKKVVCYECKNKYKKNDNINLVFEDIEDECDKQLYDLKEKIPNISEPKKNKNNSNKYINNCNEEIKEINQEVRNLDEDMKSSKRAIKKNSNDFKKRIKEEFKNDKKSVEEDVSSVGKNINDTIEDAMSTLDERLENTFKNIDKTVEEKINVNIDVDEEIRKSLKKNINKDSSQQNKNYNNTTKNKTTQKDNNNVEHTKVNNKNIKPFYCFMSSLLPGAGQMYLGLMNRGLTIGLIFAVLVFVMQIPAFIVAVYIFSFYDTHHIKNKMLIGENVYDTIDDLSNLFKNTVFTVCILILLAYQFIMQIVNAFLRSFGGYSSSWLGNALLFSITVIIIVFLVTKYKK